MASSPTGLGDCTRDNRAQLYNVLLQTHRMHEVQRLKGDPVGRAPTRSVGMGEQVVQDPPLRMEYGGPRLAGYVLLTQVLRSADALEVSLARKGSGIRLVHDQCTIECERTTSA
ncbi:unnamed protein product [Linum trigynum]|uniref:Uncharacterized protein n=1 Tax=Linum trigynum TaxID=586398 RepID=A0AAV2GC65_9ROSI